MLARASLHRPQARANHCIQLQTRRCLPKCNVSRGVASIDRVKAVHPRPQVPRRQWLKERAKFENLEQFIAYLNTLESVANRTENDDQVRSRSVHLRIIVYYRVSTLR